MPSFTNREDFEKWLEDKPAEWAQLLALRSALRVLPIALNPANFRDGPAHARLTGAILRACAITWAARKIPAHEMAASAAYAASAAARAASAAARAASAAYAAYAAADAASAAAYAASAAYAAADAASAAAYAASAAASAAAYAASAAASAAAWSALSADTEWLEESDQPTIGLLARPLWPKGDNPVNEAWESASAWLRANDLSLWAEWYQRRLDGHANGFALPADADREIADRLLSADDDWWTGGDEEPGLEQFQRVTREIKRWIAELAPRDPRLPNGSQPIGQEEQPDLTNVIPFPQLNTAPRFVARANSQVGLDFNGDVGALRTDQEAVDRHAEALRLAQELSNMCGKSNSLGHIRSRVDDIIAAIGGDIAAMRPSQLVQRAERLRRIAAIYENLDPRSLYENLDEFEFEQLQAVRDSLNLLIGAEPILDTLDQARLGPDRQEELVAPAALQAAVAELNTHETFDPETEAYIAEAVDLADPIPNPNNRQSRQVDSIAQNLMRYSVEIICTYPHEAAWVAAFGGVTTLILSGPVAVLVGAVGGIAAAYQLGRNILANEDFYRKAAGKSPANRANFERVLGFLKSLPLKSLRDNDEK